MPISKPLRKYSGIEFAVRAVVILCIQQISGLQTTAQNDIRNIDNIFCIGNGRLIEYGAKADILQLFGPPYSSPSMLDLKLTDTTLQVVSVRERGTAIWTHTLLRGNRPIGKITDLMDSSAPVMIRKFMMNEPVSFRIHFRDHVRIIDNTTAYFTNRVKSALLAESPRGAYFYNDYPVPFKQYLQLAVAGNAKTDSNAANNYTLQVSPGESYLYLAGGPLYPDCISHTMEALSVSYNTISNRSHIAWSEFTGRRINFEKTLRPDIPEREKLLGAIDATAVNIKTQQSVEGGVLAGHNYHLGYVRDQYGVSRGLLKMGYYNEARAILDFFWQRWKWKGVLHNAQGIDIDIFHIHENDEVEITGYLVIQAFDYFEKTGDSQFLNEIFPMLQWAFNAQTKNLYKNMLPFNGDETYVAGGILPRSCLIDGSAEATSLFITGGEKLISFAKKNNLWNKETVGINTKIIDQVKQAYRENFYKDGKLICNNPERAQGVFLPLFRHGVCEGLGAGCEFYAWTQKNENNRYLCPVCFTKVSLAKTIPRIYQIQSVSLMPLYMGSSLFTRKEIQELMLPMLKNYETTGRLPSRPDGNVTVGYDYGLLLFNLNLLNDSLKIRVYKEMMALLDQTGAWTEYYENGKATGTRYRPWESAINIEAAIDFAQQHP